MTKNVKKAWGEGNTDERTVQTWLKKFRSRNYSLEDKERNRKPSKIDHDVLKRIIEEDPRQSVSEVAAKIKILKHKILKHKISSILLTCIIC